MSESRLITETDVIRLNNDMDQVTATDEPSAAQTWNMFMRKGAVEVPDKTIPFHAIDHINVYATANKPPTITGANNVDIWENSTFDPMDGVSATDKDGNSVPVTYTGTVDTSTPGIYMLTYSATDSEGLTSTVRRRVRVKEVPAPRFTGLTPIVVNTTSDIDLEEGVHAWVENTEIAYTYTPTIVDSCTPDVTTVTYTATANGKVTTQDRTVTVRRFDPLIHGNTPLTVFVNTEVDVLDGLTGEEGSGDTIPVVLDETTHILTKTLAGTDTEIEYLDGSVVNLEPGVPPSGFLFKGWYDNPGLTGTPITSVTMNASKQIWGKVVQGRLLTRVVMGESTEELIEINETVTLADPVITEDRKGFDGWYDNDAYTGTAITSVVMDQNRTVYAKVVDQVAYAMLDGGTLRFFVDNEGKYDTDPTVFKGFETTTSIPWSSAMGITEVVIADEIRPTSMTNWFNGVMYSSLADIERFVGLNKIDVSNCRTMNRTFRGNTRVTDLDLSSWDTAVLGAVIEMFADSNYRTINLTGWDVRNLGARSSRMFGGCTSLTTIYADCNLTRLSISDFFDNCISLVGGNGTAYATALEKSTAYARPDVTGVPGYFTVL